MCEKHILGTIYSTIGLDYLHMFLTFTKTALSSEGNTEYMRPYPIDNRKTNGFAVWVDWNVQPGTKEPVLSVAFLECGKQLPFKDGSPTKNWNNTKPQGSRRETSTLDE